MNAISTKPSQDKKTIELPAEKLKLDFAQLQRTLIKDLNKNLSIYNNIYKKYTKEDIRRFLESPTKYEKQLREISIFLYNASPHYKRLINYYAKMPIYAYTVSGYNVNGKKVNKRTYESTYKNILNVLDKMNIKHEFAKIMSDVFKEEIFFGYIHETKDSFYIQKLDSQYCSLSSIEDGVYLFSFDFSSIQENKLTLYPQEIQQKYQLYKTNKNLRWQELSGENTICIKFDETVFYSVPPFAGLFETIADIWEYKELKRAKTSINNYKLVGLEVPLLKDGNEADNMALSIETVTMFMNMINSSLPDGIGAFVSPMTIKTVDFKEENGTTDKVSEAISTFFTDSGTNQLLFNSDNSTGASLAMSIECDAEMVYSILRQFERWINRRIKDYGTDTYKFRLDFLNVTEFNKDKEFQRYMQMLQYGAPVIMPMLACLGYSPSQVINNNILEVDILALVDKFKPPISANVMSGKDSEGGANKKNDEDLTDSGSSTRENDGNNPDSRE